MPLVEFESTSTDAIDGFTCGFHVALGGIVKYDEKFSKFLAFLPILCLMYCHCLDENTSRHSLEIDEGFMFEARRTVSTIESPLKILS
jgi:hypothetical protein